MSSNEGFKMMRQMFSCAQMDTNAYSVWATGGPSHPVDKYWAESSLHAGPQDDIILLLNDVLSADGSEE